MEWSQAVEIVDKTQKGLVLSDSWVYFDNFSWFHSSIVLVFHWKFPSLFRAKFLHPILHQSSAATMKDSLFWGILNCCTREDSALSAC